MNQHSRPHALRLAIALAISLSLNVRTKAQEPYASARTVYFQAILKQVDSIASSYRVKLLPFRTEDVGEFPYQWTAGGGEWNYTTWDWVNRTVVSRPNGIPSLSKRSFIQDYRSAIRDITYHKADMDMIQLNAVHDKVAARADEIVELYSSTFGPITSLEMKRAQVETRINYILHYKLGQVWSGNAKAPDKHPPLTLQTLATKDITRALPLLPTTAGPLLTKIQEYASRTTPAIPLVGLSKRGEWVLRAVSAIAADPSIANGAGIIAVHDDGSRTVVPEYKIAKPISTILAELENMDNGIRFRIEATRSDRKLVHLTVDGSSPVHAPVDFISLNDDLDVHESLYSLRGVGNNVNVQLSFNGLSYVPIAPKVWDYQTHKGWFAERPLGEAFANGNNRTSGYRFKDRPSFDFSDGGNFGRVTGVVITSHPTVTVTYTAGEIADFQETFPPDKNWSISLFGLSLGADFGQRLYRVSMKTDPKSGGITLTMTPQAAVIESVPVFDRRLPVVAASVDYPIANDIR